MDLGGEEEPHLYLPLTQSPHRTMFVVANVRGDPSGFAARIREIVQGVDPSMPVWALRDLESYRLDSTAQPRFRSVLFSLFAGIGPLLASVGTYSVMSRALQERQREIAIRVSMGATAVDIVRLAFTWAGRVGTAAMVVGVFCAMLVSRVLESMLYGVGSLDPFAYFVSVELILVNLAGATLVPAGRAWRPLTRCGSTDDGMACREIEHSAGSLQSHYRPLAGTRIVRVS